jgi:hypothetical protein
MGTRSLPGVKRPESGVNLPTESRSEVKERGQLYLYPPLGLQGLLQEETYSLTNKFASWIVRLFYTHWKLWRDDPCVRAVHGLGLRPLACCPVGFESRRRHSCQSRLLYLIMYRSLRRADHSSRGVLTHVSVSQSVVSKSQHWGGLRPIWLPSYKKTLWLLFYYIWLFDSDVLNFGGSWICTDSIRSAG